MSDDRIGHADAGYGDTGGGYDPYADRPASQRPYGGRGNDQHRGHAQGTGSAYQIAPLVVGGLMTALGIRRGGWLGYGVALAGLGVMQQGFSGQTLTHTMERIPGLRDYIPAGHDHEAHAVTVSHAVTIDKPAAEIYRYWRDFSNLPRFMENLERVEIVDNDHSRWTAKGPAGLTVSWEAEVTDDQPDRRIAWRSLPEADVPNWGHVEFRPAPSGGTEVHAVIRYEPPAGMLGRAVAKLLGREPQQQMKADLARLKRMMETGQGSLHASRSMAGA